MPLASNPAPIARLLGEFSCAETEVGFLQEQAGPMLRHLRRALLLCSLFFLVFGVNDIAVLGWPRAWPSILARVASALLALGAVAYAGRRGADPRAVFHATSMYTTGWLTCFLVVASHRPQDVLLHVTSMAILVMVVHIFLPNRTVHAFLIALAGTIGFVCIAWYQHMENFRQLASMTMILAVANGFGAIAANRHATLWREQYWTQQVLKNLSIRDPLTGCYNRRHLNASLLDGEIARARRHRQSLSLIMCDLDGFKAVNDTHGHHAGDLLLRRFADLLHGLTREAVDTVVRYGGEEFLIILPGTALDGAAELAERVRAAFAAERVDCGDELLTTTASFGVVGADFAITQAPAAKALIAAADELMYEAKRAGRNRVCARALMQGFVQAA